MELNSNGTKFVLISISLRFSAIIVYFSNNLCKHLMVSPKYTVVPNQRQVRIIVKCRTPTQTVINRTLLTAMC